MPELVLELNGRTWTLDPSRSYTIGRDPQADVVVEDPRVSWRHATVRWGGQGWVVEDHGSTNGTYAQGQRVQRLDIGPGSVVHLGNATDGPRLTLAAPATAPAGAPSYGAQAPAAGAPPQQQPPQAPPAAWGAPPQQPPGWQQQAPSQAPPQQQGGAPTPPAQQVPPQASPQQAAATPQAPSQGQPPQQATGQPARQTTGQAGGPGLPGVTPAAQGPAGGTTPAGTTGYADRSPTNFHMMAAGRVMRIGRALENDLVVSDLQVSRNHAEFRTLPDGRFEIVDLGSHNGTYVNGQPVRQQVIGPNDIVGVGHSTFRLVGDRLEEFVDTGEVSFSARHLTVTVDGGKQILRNVSFSVPEKSLVAVIGPSGSGKSTLLRALTGYRPANQGDVLYDHRNLYEHFAELRQRIGLVPQDDILHKELRVRTALRYAAKLRFPGDTARAEREARIDEVLRELKLDVHADKKVTSLSGGQRKRVSVALELLTKPSLIFLDEPTSGLDPGMDRDVMQLLRGLADDGRTVLVVTHSVAELALCDKLLVMAPGGAVAYFGPPDEALNFFGYDSWADVFSAFENYRDYDWAGRWQGSQHYQLYAGDVDAISPAESVNVQSPPARIQKSQSWGSQLWTLIRRYLSVIASDRGFMGLMVILPAVLGTVSVVIPAKFGLQKAPMIDADHPTYNPSAGTIMMILVVGMCFTGSANSVRELIKERVIYERERAVGLSRSAYLMSKVLVLGAVTALQGMIITAIGLAPRKLPDQGAIFSPSVELCLAMVAIGFTSMMFGLVISSLVKTAEKTMPLLVMFAVVQVVFTGVMLRLYSSPGVEEFAWLMPSRWALSATGATLDLGPGAGHMMRADDGYSHHPDPLWTHSAGQWSFDILVLVALGIAYGFLVARLLRRHEPEVMRK